jgi:hypothetical protein
MACGDLDFPTNPTRVARFADFSMPHMDFSPNSKRRVRFVDFSRSEVRHGSPGTHPSRSAPR